MSIAHKSFILVCALLTATITATAQHDDTQKQYSDQYAKLYKAYSKSPDDVECMLLLSEFYADTLNPMRDYAAAMKLVSAAEKRLIALVEDRDQTKEVRLLLRKGVTVVRVRQTKRDIIRLARSFISSDEPLPEKTIDSYAEAFSDDPYVMRNIEHRRIQYRFQQAINLNTMEGYKNFIGTYAATDEGEKALKMMTKLAEKKVEDAKTENEVDNILNGYLEFPPIQNVAYKRKSAIAYDEVLRNPGPAAYRSFLSRYPGSDEYTLVLAKIEALSEAEFSTLSTPRQLADFAHNNPDNPLADQAIDQLKQIIREQHDPEAIRIYLDEFPLDFDHDNIYLEYFSWHTEEGNKAPIVRFKILNPNFPFSRSVKEALAEATKIDSIDIYMPYAEKDFQQWASKIYHLTGKKISFVALQRTLQHLIAEKDWKKVLERMDFFSISFEDNCQKEIAELRSIIEANPKMEMTHIVRPAYDFIHPVMMPDGAHILYNRFVNDHLEIHCAEKTAGRHGTVWRGTGAIPFSNFINNGLQLYNLYNNGANMLVGYRGNIMTAELRGDTWTITETLPAPVNSKSNDFDAFMLPDGSGILFASDREGGKNLQPTRSRFHGDTALASDIWFAPKTDNGWGNPINLGLNINSIYMECSPVLSDDLKTLFFITDGRGGLGYGDIYYSTRDNTDDWTHWSKPVNCGKLVNTGFNEASISMSPDHKHLIVGSNCGGHYGCYSFPLPNIHNSNMTTVSVIPDEYDMTITIVDVASQKELFTNQIVKGGSPWQTSLYSNKSYLLFTQYKDLLTPGILFVPSSRSTIDPVAYDTAALLQMSRQGRNLIMSSILFENKSHQLLPSSLIEIANIATFLKHNPSLSLEVVTHVEGSDDSFCYELSQQRGQEIKKQLTQLGINPDNITVSPYGNSATKRGHVKSSTTLLFHQLP